MSDFKVTSILTEHLGYPPITVVDDVINAVNHILYKCTQAMETYLKERQQDKSTGRDEIWEKLEDREIKEGTVKLETLLENQVDKNFDKFELYALRNIFTIPNELVEGGFITLDHHQGIFEDLQKTDKSDVDNDEIKQLIEHIQIELKCRKLLKLQIEKGKRILKILNDFKESIKFLSDESIEKLTFDNKKLIAQLSPIEDNLKFTLNQADNLVKEILVLHEKIVGRKLDFKFTPNKRDYYINGKIYKILQNLGVELDESNALNFDKVNDDDLNNLKSLS
ncbi:kinetochore-associated protein Mtw1p [[Candida] jaroonii]|uniref:Kinetochore-associated protein Mtw1p n=1 Tax=[Candida] jaroonii TaxID=467808 RepID=A0ACA9YAK2_9ASCO|nr:kinetochore-associated protein Mtw1p [[Candida] jaroonii]